MTEELVNFKDWTLRERPGSGDRILLLLHGWTGDENSMSVFTRNFPSSYWILAPRAPYPAQPKGFSWRAPAPRGSWPTIDLFRPSIEKLLTLVDEWGRSKNLSTQVFDVAGFSQGGALTFTLGVLHPERVGKMGILAGFAPQGANTVVSPGLLAGKEVFMAHGTRDEMVPIEMAHATIELLKYSGATVNYCESDVGHKLSADCLRSLEHYLSN